ncbi:MAG: FG-GAP repeat protein [Actinobacteria bacterium]|nr:FG-GAP repeat protein [Actinomycetota bacterium]
MRRAAAILAAATALAVATVVPAGAGEPIPAEEFETLAPLDWSSRDFFGQSIAVDGDRVVVGAMNNNEAGLKAGAAWVFTRSGLGWQIDKIVPDEPYGGYRFGTGVAVRGDRVVVGAAHSSMKGKRSGSVFVYDYVDGEWVETQRFLPEGVGTNTGLGMKVALSDDGKLILASTDNHRQDYEMGRAFVFEERPNGSWKTTELVSDDLELGDYFGTMIGVGDGFLAVGSPYNDEAGDDAGAVYVFEQTDGVWAQTAKLLSPEPVDGVWYGGGVEAEGDRIIVSAYGENALYLIHRSGEGWEQERIELAEPQREAVVGQWAMVSGDRVYATFWPQGKAEAKGNAVIVFERGGDGWEESYRYDAEDFGGGLGFAWRFIDDGGVVAISQPGAPRGGLAYVAGMPATCGGFEPTVVGTNGDDVLAGTVGDDVIVPGSGSDVIEVTPGRDVYCLQDGTYRFTAPVAGTTVESGLLRILVTDQILPAWEMLSAE